MLWNKTMLTLRTLYFGTGKSTRHTLQRAIFVLQWRNGESALGYGTLHVSWRCNQSLLPVLGDWRRLIQNRVAYLAFLASSSSISALAMSPALCCRMTSTSERLSTRSRMSSVRACSCWGVLGISMLSTSLATASMLSRSALSSTRWGHITKMWVNASDCQGSVLKFSSNCSPKKQNNGKKFLPRTSSKPRGQNRFLGVKLPSEKRPSRRVGPAGIALLEAFWRSQRLATPGWGWGDGDASPQERKPTAAHKCNCANSTLSPVQTQKERVCHAATH